MIAFNVYLWLPSENVPYASPPDANISISFDIDCILTLAEDESIHFRDVAAARNCYIEGTDVPLTMSSNSDRCRCKPNYYGSECGIPAAVWFRRNQSQWPLKPRKKPRRIIHALNINHEIDFFHARLEELQVTDKGPNVFASNLIELRESNDYLFIGRETC